MDRIKRCLEKDKPTSRWAWEGSQSRGHLSHQVRGEAVWQTKGGYHNAATSCKEPPVYPQTVSGLSQNPSVLTLGLNCVLVFTLNFFEEGLLSRPIVLVKRTPLLSPINWKGI